MATSGGVCAEAAMPAIRSKAAENNGRVFIFDGVGCGGLTSVVRILAHVFVREIAAEHGG